MTINFKTNKLKLLNSIIYILKKLIKTDMHKICKILFYADKNHLNKYGRPVTGDCFIKMDNGPVPSLIYDMLKMNYLSLEEEFFKELKSKIAFEKAYYSKLKNEQVKFDDKYFSETDLEKIDNAIEFCKDKTFNELSELTHLEKSWREVPLNTGMNIESFLNDDNKNKEIIIEDLKEISNFMMI